jgi:hypothetical protein
MLASMKKLILCLILGRHDDDTLEVKHADYYATSFVALCDRCR